MADIARRRSAGLAALPVLPLLLAVAAGPGAAQQALPQNPSVVSGGVTIGPATGANLAVTQTTPRAVVNWQSFSIGQPNAVTFHQPDASSAILNRVTGSTTSTIAGQLNANGQVFLVNPNGIAITSTGAVKTGGGFVGSTLDIRDEDFMAGRLEFSGGGTSAGISNAGSIMTAPGGFVALLGGSVSNSGTISVPLGRVGLGSGERATLDLYGDGFLQVAVPTGSGVEGALVESSGTIDAPGSRVELKAATVREAIREAVNMSGVISARSVSGRNGAIVLGGGSGGNVRVTGKVSASGKRGAGKIDVSGRNVTIDGAAKLTARSTEGNGGQMPMTAGEKLTVGDAQIDASGHNGGGTVLLGGDYQGDGTLAHARETVIGADTVIRSDATGEGTGGTVVVWSDSLTSFRGRISARGAGSGDGGLAEVSSKGRLAFGGLVDLTAERGRFGTLLLDPEDIVIADTDPGGAASFLSTATLQSQLALGDVVVKTDALISGSGNITVGSAVTWSADTLLTLDAANSIFINAPITATGTNAGVALDPGAGGTYTLAPGAAITLSGANATFSIDGQAFTLIRDVDALQAMQSGLSGRYALAIDIDASTTAGWEGGFSPVGNASTTFAGTFDGLGHTVIDLTIARPSQDHVGLFGYAANATIRNVGLVGGAVEGRSYVGGLVGRNVSGTVETSYATGAVTGTSNYIGGLVGENSGTVETSYATGAVEGYSYVGGLVGFNSSGTVETSYATGAVEGYFYVGGLVGFNSSGTVETSYATGTVTGNSSAGGLVGFNSGAVSHSYALGAVTGSTRIGGLVGYNYYTGTIKQSYATGRVSGSSNVGGLVGSNSTEFSSCGTFSGCNYWYYGGTISDSYWDRTTTGRSNACGPNSGTCAAIGLTTAQARTQSNYSAFDFTNDWVMFDGTRPFLRAEYSTAISNAHQLQLMALDPTASYTLARNIDASETAGTNAAGMWSTAGFSPVGNISTPFTGTFDGFGHSISGFTIDRPTQNYVGLFGGTDGALVRNVGLVGGFVSGKSYVGGVVGYNVNSSISSSFSSSTVTGEGAGETFVGGLVGVNISSTITASYTTGDVVATGLAGAIVSVGGLVGANANGSSISASFATGSVQGVASSDPIYSNSLWVGGLVGNNVSSTILNSFHTTGSIRANSTGSRTSSYIGGLVGRNSSGSVTASYASGPVEATGMWHVFAGGLSGLNADGGQISTSYATADVTSTQLGSGVSYVGGLVGYNTANTSISMTYGTGSVEAINSGAGSSQVGGLVGHNDSTVHLSYWDVQASGMTVGIGGGSSLAGATGRTTAEMQDITNFSTNYVGWDFATTWVPPNQTGQGGDSAAHYPELYALSRVVAVKAGAQITYGDSRPDFGASHFGGFDATTGKTLYEHASESIDPDTIADGITFADPNPSDKSTTSFDNAGVYTLEANAVSDPSLTSTGQPYRIVVVPGAYTVAKAELTISATGQDKVYDGTTGATVTLGDDRVAGDVLVLGYGGASFADKNAGSGKTVTVSGITLGGADAGNYTFNTTALTTADISQLALTVTALGQDKVYDGTTGATVTLGDDRVAGDVLVLGYGGASFADKNAGSGKTVTVSGITLGGADAGNYTFNTTALTTADISQLALTVTANGSSKVYGNTLTFAGTEFTVAGLVSDDEVTSVTLTSTGAAATATVGEYAIIASDAAGSGLGTTTSAMSTACSS